MNENNNSPSFYLGRDKIQDDEEMHKKAFLLFLEYGDLEVISKMLDIPVELLFDWKGNYVLCDCPYHNWEEKRKSIMLKVKDKSRIPKLELWEKFEFCSECKDKARVLKDKIRQLQYENKLLKEQVSDLEIVEEKVEKLVSLKAIRDKTFRDLVKLSPRKWKEAIDGLMVLEKLERMIKGQPLSSSVHISAKVEIKKEFYSFVLYIADLLKRKINNPAVLQEIIKELEDKVLELEGKTVLKQLEDKSKNQKEKRRN